MDEPIRILVIDDDATNRRLLVAALAKEGAHEVVAVASHAEALQTLAAHPAFALVICDLVTPDASGMQFIHEIRFARPMVPLLVLAAVLTNETVARALEYGADDYLQKPVDLRELRRAVAVLVNRRAHRKTSTSLEIDDTRPLAHRSSVRISAEGAFVELTAPTDPLQAERFQRFAERLLSTSLSEKERYNLHLALEEILRNAIEWGNNNDRNKTLRLSYCILSDRITFRIEDEGDGFDHAALRDPSLNPQKHIQERRASGKRMGGWGVFLTRKVMDEVVYNDKGNVVFLTKYLRRPSSQVLAAVSAAEGAVFTLPNAATPSAADPAPAGHETTRLLRRKDLPSIHPGA